MADNLPSYEEQPIAVSMSAELVDAYRDLEAKLKDEVAKLLRRGNHQLLSGMLHALLAYPDFPYDWQQSATTKVVGSLQVATPPTLDRDTLWPKERKLLEILAAEKAQHRQCWVFACYTRTHPVLARLEQIIGNAGFTCESARRRQGSHTAP